MPVKGEVAAGLTICSTEVNAFDDRALDTGKAFAAFARVALANMHLYEGQGQVAEQLKSRGPALWSSRRRGSSWAGEGAPPRRRSTS